MYKYVTVHSANCMPIFIEYHNKKLKRCDIIMRSIVKNMEHYYRNQDKYELPIKIYED